MLKLYPDLTYKGYIWCADTVVCFWFQDYGVIRARIIQQQVEYRKKRVSVLAKLI